MADLLWSRLDWSGGKQALCTTVSDRCIPSATLLARAGRFAGCVLGIPSLFQSLEAGMVVPAK